MRNVAWFLILAGISFVVGCNLKGNDAKAARPSEASSASLVAGPGGSESGAHNGQQVFNNKCGRCHSVEEGRRGRAPNLGKIGNEHDAEWIAAFVRDPRAQKPNARMGKLDENQVSSSDLKLVAEYLASLK